MNGGVNSTGTERAISNTGVNINPEASRGPAIATHSTPGPQAAAKIAAARGVEGIPAAPVKSNGNKVVKPEVKASAAAEGPREGAEVTKDTLKALVVAASGNENATTYEAPQLASAEEDTGAQDNQIAVNDPWGGAGATFA